MDKKESMKVLMMMARADQKLDPTSTSQKLGFLAQRARSWGMTQDEYFELFQTVMMGPVNIKMFLPTDKDEQTELLNDLVQLMMLDGDAHDGQMQMLKQISTAFGITPQSLASMVSEHM